MNYTFNNYNKTQYQDTPDVTNSERTPQVDSEPTSEAPVTSQPEVNVVQPIHREVQVRPEVRVEAQPEAQTWPSVRAEIQPTAQPQPEVRVEAQPVAQPQPVVRVEAQPVAQPQPEVRVEAQPVAQPQPEAKPKYPTEIAPVYIQRANIIPLEKLSITKTSKTPEVLLDPRQGKYSIVGRSLPEDAVAFYQRIISWLERFHASHNFETEVCFELELEYFNTSSSKCLLNVFKEIGRMHDAGKQVSILWRYDEDDEDMEETGEDYRDLLSVPFTLQGIEY